MFPGFQGFLDTQGCVRVISETFEQQQATGRVLADEAASKAIL